MNIKLAYDICRCSNSACPIMENCARFTNFRDGHMNPHYGSPVSHFDGYWEHGEYHCRNFWPDEVEKHG